MGGKDRPAIIPRLKRERERERERDVDRQGYKSTESCRKRSLLNLYQGYISVEDDGMRWCMEPDDIPHKAQ